MRRLAVFFLAGTLAAGCAVVDELKKGPSEFISDYPAPSFIVWPSVVEVMEELPVRYRDEKEGVIETEWMTPDGFRPLGDWEGFLVGEKWERRTKLKVKVIGLDAFESRVRIYSTVEEQGPAKAGELPWRRVPSDGKLEGALFAEFQKAIQQ